MLPSPPTSPIASPMSPSCVPILADGAVPEEMLRAQLAEANGNLQAGPDCADTERERERGIDAGVF